MSNELSWNIEIRQMLVATVFVWSCIPNMADLPPPCPIKYQISELRLEGDFFSYEGNVAVYLALLNLKWIQHF